MKYKTIRTVQLEAVTMAPKGTCYYNLDTELVMTFENGQWMPACPKCSSGYFVYWISDEYKYSQPEWMTELIDHINEGPLCHQCSSPLVDLAEDLMAENED